MKMISATELISSRKAIAAKALEDSEKKFREYEASTLIQLEQSIERKIASVLEAESKKERFDDASKFECVIDFTMFEDEKRIFDKFEEKPIKTIGSKLTSLGYKHSYKVKNDKKLNLFSLVITVGRSDS
jgi:hypothetical protein